MKKGMKGILGLLVAFMLCAGLFTVFGVNTVKAADDIASGTHGNCDWVLDADGVLTISPTEGKNGVLGTCSSYSSAQYRYAYDRPWHNVRESVKKVVVSPGVKLPNGPCRNLFAGFINCSEMDLANLDTSLATDIAGMFYNCRSLTSLDLRHFNVSNVTDLQCVFMNCVNLESVNVTGWDVSNVKNTFMYAYFGTSGQSSASSYRGIFNNCKSLKSIDLSTWNVSNMLDVGSMFEGCTNLEEIDISSWDIRNATTSKDFMFLRCENLKRVKIGPNFVFLASKNSALPANGSGKWVRNDGAYGPYDPVELARIYTADMAGTWILSSNAYAIFSDDGVLRFIRSNDLVKNNTVGSVTSISGQTYTGTIYTDFENRISFDYNTVPWRDIKSSVVKVEFVDKISPLSTSYWFYNFKKLKEIEFNENLDTSKTTDMTYMFRETQSLKELILPDSFDTKNVTSLNTFAYYSGITTLRLPVNWDVSNVSNATNAFLGTQITKVIMDSDNNPFRLKNGSYLSLCPQVLIGNIEYTGKWIMSDGSVGPYTTEEFGVNYTSALKGVWLLEEASYKIIFVGGDGASGSMPDYVGYPSSETIIPNSKFVKYGYDFDYWDDGNGHTYKNGSTIKEKTYRAGDKVTFTAVWKKRDTSVNMEDGSFTFDIKAGEKATFNDIPAGTSYQVYELTPDGWVLVQQENASGVIEALEESAASFWNQYQPGVTTVQFSGLKTLDGHPASEGSYNFELLENGKVIDTATTQDGGFIQFKVIEYDAAGDHTYTIREVEPDDDSVDYDTHEETVTVSVTDDGKGNLSSEVTYDEDGIKFENHTCPGILRITKNADVTEANKDDKFTFEITFSNENGMPISDNIYWYVEDQN